jgi:hypothetical protein
MKENEITEKETEDEKIIFSRKCSGKKTFKVDE